MNLEYALKQLDRDKNITNGTIQSYKENIIASLPPKEEFAPKTEEVKKVKKSAFKRFFSIFS